jgi:periplasmic protein TonB
MYSEPNRAFSYAVLASIVLHGMLLFGVSQRERATPFEPQVPIVARLVEPPPPAPAPKPPAAAPRVIPPAVEPPPQAPKPRPRPKAEAPPKPVAKPAPAPEPKPAPEPPAVAEVPPAPDPAPPPVVARTEPAPPPPVAQTVPDETTLAQYRLQLLSAARKYKRYPRVAMDNNWEGDVVVRMAVGPNGVLAGLSIRSSSGYSVLDQQALEMFRKAATTVQVPPGLHGREFSFEVRAIYNLTEQNSG